jgi:branched-chain amino acid transport system permease protein
MGQVPQYLLTGVVTGAFYALVATAMQVVYGSTRILNFAQGEFVVLGMFTIWQLRSGWGLNPWLSLAVVTVVGFAAGSVFYLVCVRPFDGRPVLQIILATLAAGIALRAYFAIQFGSQAKVVQPFVERPPMRIGPLLVSAQDVLMIAGALFTLAVLFGIFRYTWIGLAMRATAENREGAELTGANPRLVSLLAFAIGSAISALAGGLIAPLIGVSFDAGLSIVLTAFVAATLGGLSSTVGAVVGGFVLGLTVAIIAATLGSDFQSVWLLLLVIALLYLRPHGVLGRRVAE